MTAEAIVMNKNAIAIAADSAVTVSTGTGGPKIWNTVNKLFNISRIAPVAGMVYGNAEFSGFPWETLMKSYRSHLADKTYNTLQEYADDLVAYLRSVVAHNEIDEFDFAQVTRGHFYHLSLAIQRKIDGEFPENADENELVIWIENAIVEYEACLRTKETVDCLEDLSEREFFTQYAREILRVRRLTLDETIGNLLSRGAKKAIWRISYLSCVKDTYSINSSGLVIAGFGESQFFPSIREYTVDGVICGRIKYKVEKEEKISHAMQAVIIPFAQSDMVYQFMEGVDIRYRIACKNFYADVMQFLRDMFVKKYVRSKKRQSEVSEDLAKISYALEGAMEKKLREFRQRNFTNPVIEVVKNLPKDELAMLTESLVQLTSLRRRVSNDLETVGEPIDVAVISKGDGFIWIKRKHYFRPELNQRFLQNYAKR